MVILGLPKGVPRCGQHIEQDLAGRLVLLRRDGGLGLALLQVVGVEDAQAVGGIVAGLGGGVCIVVLCVCVCVCVCVCFVMCFVLCFVLCFVCVCVCVCECVCECVSTVCVSTVCVRTVCVHVCTVYSVCAECGRRGWRAERVLRPSVPV